MSEERPFTELAWSATADIRAAIDGHAFLSGLRDGTLPRDKFIRYLIQDAHYLIGYAPAPAGHPYQAWIATYGDPAFAAAGARARDIVDRSARKSSPEVQRAMQTAFAAASRYEWMFSGAAWRGETWPDFGVANGNASTTATPKEATEADSHG